MARFGAELLLKGIDPSGPFSRVLAAANVPRTSLLYRWFDFLAFALSGLPVDQTSAAAIAFMIKEFFADGAVMDCTGTTIELVTSVCCPPLVPLCCWLPLLAAMEGSLLGALACCCAVESAFCFQLSCARVLSALCEG